MPSEVKKPIFQKLLKRLNVAQGSQKAVILMDSVQPVLDVNTLTNGMNYTYQSSSATGDSLTATVPDGKRWEVKAVAVTRTNAGPFILQAGLAKNTTGGTAVDIYRGASGTGFYYTFPNEFVLNSGDVITVVNGAGTSGSIVTVIWYLENDA